MKKFKHLTMMDKIFVVEEESSLIIHPIKILRMATEIVSGRDEFNIRIDFANVRTPYQDLNLDECDMERYEIGKKFYSDKNEANKRLKEVLQLRKANVDKVLDQLEKGEE